MPKLGEEMRPAIERFEEKVNKDGPLILASRCWAWIGAVDKDGYGRIGYQRKVVRAHRLSYVLHKGPITQGRLIQHACDNTLCVNPEHLSIGTNHTNRQDCRNKDRLASAKLKVGHVRAIKLLMNLGISEEWIAEAFGIHKTTVSCIRRGKTWQQIRVDEPVMVGP